MAEKFKMGFDTQKNFAQMYEDGNMEDGVGEKMMQLDSVIIQKSKKSSSSKGYQICARNRAQKQRFRPCGPGLDATGLQI